MLDTLAFTILAVVEFDAARRNYWRGVLAAQSSFIVGDVPALTRLLAAHGPFGSFVEGDDFYSRLSANVQEMILDGGMTDTRGLQDVIVASARRAQEYEAFQPLPERAALHRVAKFLSRAYSGVNLRSV